MSPSSHSDPDSQPQGSNEPGAKEHPAVDAESIAADVSDFVADYLDDEAEGTVRTLDTYLRRYPRAQGEVALEYLRLSGKVEEGPAPGGEAATADGGGDGARRIGRYRLLRLLGKGGQGEVWLAEDESLQRPVALKLLQGSFVTEDRRQRFRREAETIARLEHPGLAQVHDADVDGDVPFIAMRFVDGHDLAAALAQGRRRGGELASDGPSVPPLIPCVPESKAERIQLLRFFERAARALHAAHEAGVLHRDVKPGNIMITPEGRPVVLDFGLARETDVGEGPGGGSSAAPLTREGDVFGTLAYMAPEQLRGEMESIDGRVDVWALGATLFEALTGERPFQGNTPLEIARAIERGAPVAARGDALPTDVRVVLATALDPSRDRRYGSALALAEDLRRIVEYEPIRARPAGPLLRLGRWCRREPAWAAALGVAVVALIAGLAMTQVSLREERRNLEEERALNDEISERIRQIEARERASAVPALMDQSPAGALALGLDAVDRDNTWLIRSTLYGPLVETTLLHALKMPKARVWDALFVSESRVLVASAGGAIALFDVGSGDQLALLEVESDVVSLDYERGAALGYAGLASGELIAFDPQGLQVRWRSQCGSAPVRDVAVAGSRVVATSDLEAVAIFDAATGAELGRIEGGGEAIARLCASPDGRLVVAADTVVRRRARSPRSRIVRVIDVESMGVRHQWEHPSEVVDVQVALGSPRAATMDLDGTARVFDLGTGREVVALRPGAVEADARGARVALSPDGGRVALGYEPPPRSPFDGDAEPPATVLVRALQGADARPVGSKTGWEAASVTNRILALSFSSDGSRLAAADFFGRVHVWGASDGTGYRVHNDRARMNGLRFAPDGSSFASFGVSRFLYVWRAKRSPAAFRVSPAVPGDPKPVTWGRFCLDGTRVALLDAKGRAGLFAATELDLGAGRQAEPGALLQRLDSDELGEESPLARLALSQDQTLSVWVDPVARRAVFVDLASGRRSQVSLPDAWEAGEIRELAVSDCEGGEGQGVALVVDAGGAAWVLPAGGAARSMPESTDANGWSFGAFVGESGRDVVLGASLDDVRVVRGLEYAEGAGSASEVAMEVPELSKAAPRGITAIDLAKDGSELVASTAYGRVYRWSLESGQLRPGAEARLKAFWVHYLDAERVVVAAQGRGTNRVLGGAAPVVSVAHHASAIRSMAVATAAGACLTGSEGGAVLAWDLSTGAPLVRAEVHQGAVHSVDAHGERGEMRMLSCGDDGAIVLPLNVVEVAREASPRGFSSLDQADLATILGVR